MKYKYAIDVSSLEIKPFQVTLLNQNRQLYFMDICDIKKKINLSISFVCDNNCVAFEKTLKQKLFPDNSKFLFNQCDIDVIIETKMQYDNYDGYFETYLNVDFTLEEFEIVKTVPTYQNFLLFEKK